MRQHHAVADDEGMNTTTGLEMRRLLLAVLFGGTVMQVVAFFLFAAGMKPQMAWALAAAPATITALTVARQYRPGRAEDISINLPAWRIAMPLTIVAVVGIASLALYF